MSRNPGRIRNWLRLGAVVITISVIWSVVLPRIAAWPQFQARVDRHRALGINVDAMFYTELGPVEGIELVTIQQDGKSVVVKRRFTLGSTD